MPCQLGLFFRKKLGFDGARECAEWREQALLPLALNPALLVSLSSREGTASFGEEGGGRRMVAKSDSYFSVQ